jgi:hypothetical protein
MNIEKHMGISQVTTQENKGRNTLSDKWEEKGQGVEEHRETGEGTKSAPSETSIAANERG